MKVLVKTEKWTLKKYGKFFEQKKFQCFFGVFPKTSIYELPVHRWYQKMVEIVATSDFLLNSNISSNLLLESSSKFVIINF